MDYIERIGNMISAVIGSLVAVTIIIVSVILIDCFLFWLFKKINMKYKLNGKQTQTLDTARWLLDIIFTVIISISVFVITINILMNI